MTKEEDSTTEGQVLCQNCTTPIDIRLDFENYGNSALSSMIGILLAFSNLNIRL